MTTLAHWHAEQAARKKRYLALQSEYQAAGRNTFMQAMARKDEALRLLDEADRMVRELEKADE